MDKKLVQQYLKKGDKIKTTIIYDDGKIFELNVKGEIKTVADSGFSKKQLEQIAQVVSAIVNPRFDKIEARLDRVEQRLDVLESLPTIQNELKLQK